MSDFAMKCAMKKRAKKMADGGGVHEKNLHKYKDDKGSSETGSHVRSANRSASWAKDPRSSGPEIERSMSRDSMQKAKESAAASLFAEHDRPKPKLQGLAKGGFIEDEEMSGFEEHEGDDKKHDGPAMMEDDRMLNEHGEYEEGPQGAWMAKGGSVMRPERYRSDQGTSAQGFAVRSGNRARDWSKSPNASSPSIEREMATESYDKAKDIQQNKPRMAKGGMIGSHQSDADEMDMVHRIIGKHKERMYSKGGMIANGGDDDLDRMADGAPNNFDDLSLRDDLESSNSGANSGDELGNKAEEHDRDDIVSRVHKSWKKKDKNPRPA